MTHFNSLILNSYFQHGTNNKKVYRVLQWLHDECCLLSPNTLITTNINTFLPGVFALCYLPIGVRTEEEIKLELEETKERINFSNLKTPNLKEIVLLSVAKFVYAPPSLVLKCFVKLHFAHLALRKFHSGEFYTSFPTKPFVFSPPKKVSCNSYHLSEVLTGFLSSPNGVREGLVMLCLNYLFTKGETMGYLASFILRHIRETGEELENQIKGERLLPNLNDGSEFPSIYDVFLEVQSKHETAENQAIFNLLLY